MKPAESDPARPIATPPDLNSPRRRSVLLALAWYDHRAHRGATRYALEHGWHLDATMANSSEFAWGWQGDGILCKLGCTKINPDYLRFVKDLGLPAVDLSVFGQNAGLPSLEFDPLAIAQQASDHFFERGIRNFAWYPNQAAPPIQYRERAYVAHLKCEGHVTDLIPNFEQANEKTDWREAAQQLGRHLQSLPRPLGVLCFSDEWGLKVLEACQQVGLQVPEDVAVLGINNNTLVCESLSTPLSSVALDMENWAYQACAMLDRIMDGEPMPKGLTPYPSGGVVTRRSTDTVAVEHPEVARAVTYIAEHYRQPIGVDDVVDATRLTRPGLKRAFKTHLRRSIREEVQRVRVRHIKRLLIETDWTIETIAEEVGLGGPRQLYQTFERVESMTPRQYRIKYRPAAETVGR
ncbi:MAG: substrate-binding domain-containing protein [Planctomycetota bacterium]